ncbi:ABC transporter substrate-binding protein [Nocardioides flavus (ex Wang et al. 2016)]|uniref:ABC transporter substrate-binding protein n=1 Tax=Nocardioides flavus (ex Wang et al. 2016) TaxID=2058780 RepID=A0ABQ3HFR4_9ACTN|nr:MCE family protein [Nocardioides flavus (ex Wang et al. 2016)]GHE16448.1 ABC transporter substrate-binding protein [Nocardioides flavus (ex Wang et al. 2016)]
MDLVKRILVPLVVLGFVVAAAVSVLGGDTSRTVVAHFPRAISVYEGSDVRVLGVPVGSVTRVEPTGTDVTVTMTYDDDVKLPVDAKAVIIAPSVVGDRYVQLTPAYSGTGEVLADGAELGVEDTSQPLELDQIYDSLDRLNVALGPRGANKTGALSDLLSVTADNFGGQGATFRQTVKDYSRLSSTLAGNSDELFGSVEALGGFMETLAENDQTVRQFNQSLADVSTMLAGEREELVAATRNLSVALTAVKEFVEENKGSLSRNIAGLNRVAKVLVRQRGALDEILRVAPGALNNLALTYNPQAGTLDTRANFGESINQLELDPAAFLCGFVGQVERSGQVCDRITELLARPRAGALDESPALPAQDVFDPTLGGLVEVER